MEDIEFYFTIDWVDKLTRILAEEYRRGTPWAVINDILKERFAPHNNVDDIMNLIMKIHIEQEDAV